MPKHVESFIPVHNEVMTVHSRTRQQPRVGARVGQSQRTRSADKALEHSRCFLFW